MPDLTGLPALDVVIGLAFLFFLLSTVVSTINEAIQSALNARGRALIRGIKTLIDNDDEVTKFFENQRIQRLHPPKLLRSGTRRPSYIPARTFAVTMLETANPEGTNLLKEAEKTVTKIQLPPVRKDATETLEEMQTKLVAMRVELERAFDEVMDRVSGWYKRYVQLCVLGLAVAVTVALNVNSFTVSERLWKDETLRAAVVQQAQKAVGDEKPVKPEDATPKEVAAQVDRINDLKLPIGWDKANRQDVGTTLAGWLVTIVAISLGAPFWFDVLGRLARLRGTGNREGTEKTGRAAEDRDDPSGVRSRA